MSRFAVKRISCSCMHGASLDIFKQHVKQPWHTYQSASACRIPSKSDHPWHSHDTISIFQMAATVSQLYFRFQFCWLRSSGKVEIYLHTKYRRDISIHSWDITTSSFWKQTPAMLEFYSRFRFLYLHHHRHVILYLPTKFRPNQTIYDRVMTSYPFSRWRPSGILNHLKVTADHRRSANGVSGGSSNVVSIGFILSEIERSTRFVWQTHWLTDTQTNWFYNLSNAANALDR